MMLLVMPKSIRHLRLGVGQIFWWHLNVLVIGLDRIDTRGCISNTTYQERS